MLFAYPTWWGRKHATLIDTVLNHYENENSKN
jgi:hypothetical protein